MKEEDVAQALPVVEIDLTESLPVDDDGEMETSDAEETQRMDD